MFDNQFDMVPHDLGSVPTPKIIIPNPLVYYLHYFFR
jgi:hypothetical protein